MTKYVKFMRGTTAAYKNLAEKDDDTLYFLSDSVNQEGSLYLGSRLISGPCAIPEGGNIVTSLAALSDVNITENIDFDAILVYDKHEQKWMDYSFDALTFAAASDNVEGMAGFVPAPPVGSQNLFLRGDGGWANPCSSTLIYTIETTKGQTHDNAIASVLAPDVIINDGDIVIVKDCIFKDDDNNIKKLQHTSYIYKNNKWVAMDGDYSAENVYFESDLVFTENVGTVKVESNGRATVAAAGKNVKQVFETIFSQEKEPLITLPSVELSAPENHAWEVGTKVAPTYSIALNPGSYEYGPATGITATGYKVLATDIAEEDALTETSGSFNEIEVDDNTSYYITATISYNQGEIPVTNLNNVAPGQIAAGKATKTSAELKGYRAYFYGMDDTTDVINSSYIREKLINGGIYDKQIKLTFKAADLENVKRFIVAIPSSSTRSGLISAIITSSLNANATKDYIKLADTVPVEGAHNYSAVDYDVWVYEPASIANNEIHEVTLS